MKRENVKTFKSDSGCPGGVWAAAFRTFLFWGVAVVRFVDASVLPYVLPITLSRSVGLNAPSVGRQTATKGSLRQIRRQEPISFAT